MLTKWPVKRDVHTLAFKLVCDNECMAAQDHLGASSHMMCVDCINYMGLIHTHKLLFAELVLLSYGGHARDIYPLSKGT